VTPSSSRIAALRARLGSVADAVAVCRSVNVAYVTGFEGLIDAEDPHVALLTLERAVLLTDSRYSTVAAAAAQGTEWVVVEVREDLLVNACKQAAELGATSLAVESSISHARFERFTSAFSGEIIGVSDWVEQVRMIKSPDEVSRIAAAQQLTDRAFDRVLELIRPGMSEAELALELEFYMRREGSEGIAFPPIVASGPNSALPHAKVTDRSFSAGDFLKMDFGAKVDGYCADMTRTVVIGSASDHQREVYGTVLEANLAGIAAVRSGVEARAVDATARAVIVAAGYGDNFGHGLGHGVGMEVHEQPSVGPRGTAELQAGSVITIEPGIYLPGIGGVRIEDLIVVETSGARVLSRSPKTLIEL